MIRSIQTDRRNPGWILRINVLEKYRLFSTYVRMSKELHLFESQVQSLQASTQMFSGSG